jgi:ABC-type molybdate transport system permease subunit
MGSRWEREERDVVDVEVDAPPLVDRGAGAADHGSSAARSIEAARHAARLLRIVALSIPAVGVLGYVLTSFWTDDGMATVSARQRIGGLLAFVWVPLALAALVYAASFLLTLYAARVELDATRPDASRRG